MECAQGLREALDGFDVKVVGGLVKQQHVVGRQREARQRHTRFLAATASRAAPKGQLVGKVVELICRSKGGGFMLIGGGFVLKGGGFVLT